MKRVLIRGADRNCRSKDPSTCRYHGEAFKAITLPFTSSEQIFEHVNNDLSPSAVIPAFAGKDQFGQRVIYEDETLPLDQRVALHRYSDEYGSMRIRTVLMNPEKTYDFNGETMETVHENIEGLDSLIADHSVNMSGEELWRGVKEFKHELADIQEGSVFKSMSYTATSHDPEIALSFSNTKSPILLKVKAREGYPVGGQFSGEREVLLKRDISFRVISIMENVHLEKKNFRFGEDGYIRGITLVEIEEVEFR